MIDLDAQFEKARCHYQCGRGAKARTLCREIVRVQPAHVGALVILGTLAQIENDYDNAVALFETAARLQPGEPSHAANLGLAFNSGKRHSEATAAMTLASRHHPDHGGIWNMLGLALAGEEQWERAQAAFAWAAKAEPGNHEHLYNQALAFDKSGRDAPALALYGEVLKRHPHHHDARNNLGLIHLRNGDTAEANACFQHAYGQGRHLGALINLGRLMSQTNQNSDAEQCLMQAVALAPSHSDAALYLGEHLAMTGRHGAASIYFRKVQELSGDKIGLANLLHSARWLCDFETVAALEANVVAMALEDAASGQKPALTPFMALACDISIEQEAAIARGFSVELERQAGNHPPLWQPVNRKDVSQGRKLRVGYLSNDFRDQATAHLVVGLLEKHDRNRFRIWAFSHTGPANDPYRTRIEAAVDQFVDITDLNHDQAARRIAEEEIDLLIDLKGHTKGNRLGIFARRPAPLQMTYLGFPGTTGASFMDVLVADEIVMTQDARDQASEAIALMQDCYQANDNRAEIADSPASRADVNLPEDVMVYACFNEPWKIDARSFAVWCAILKEVPASLLWLRADAAETKDNLRQAAKQHGIDASRLKFAPKLSKPEHLARIRLADLFLDTFTVNAHTTAADALWAGLPLITVTGSRFAARVATSLLHASEMPDLACPDIETYQKLAIALGNDSNRLESLRKRCKEARTTTLFDTQRQCRSFEDVLEAAWLQHSKTVPDDRLR